MANQIVTVNVAQRVAPAPSTLQRTGAVISQGGTTTAPGTLTLITQFADLTAILSTAKPITSMVWSASVVTVTTTAPHGWTVSDVIPVVIAGVTPVGYNGPVTATITGASTFTYPLVGNPGSVTVQGSVILADEGELVSEYTTFFAQGVSLSNYVLELGETTVTEGVAALGTWITNNPNKVYSYLVPREWDGDAGFITFLGNFTSTTARTYFFVTTTLAQYAAYPVTLKCLATLVQAPATAAAEFTMAAPWWVSLNYNPSSTNKVTPFGFSFLYGVTPYPIPGNSSTLAALKAANVNYVGTGAEGGISTSILFWGHLMDGNPFNYWYSIDWASINLELTLANAVINGSNDPLAPLDYNQQGINVLQDKATQVLRNGITYGMLTGQVIQTQLPADQFKQNFEDGLYTGLLVINAEPFLAYTSENPNDYAIGRYAGFAAVITPARGFESIIFDLTATNFI